MNRELVDKIVQAVLYEGYILYPYRPSVKNHTRWTFGGVYPRAYVTANPGADVWQMQSQCIVTGSERSTLSAKVRFLHLMQRTTDPGAQSWQEAVEREVSLNPASLGALCREPIWREFSFPGSRVTETDATGSVLREQQEIHGVVEMSATLKTPGVYQLTVRIENRTALQTQHLQNRDEALMRSFASTHTVLNVIAGEFISLTDPPEAQAGLISQCENIGCWPVLVGNPGETDTLLASPIILYDYPQIAPESPGDLFDGTEIDEILSLRIMTLTDEEKTQAAATDDRVRRMLARTESLARGQMMNLHGTVRGLKPAAPEHRHA